MEKLLKQNHAFYQARGAGDTAREIAQQPAVWRELTEILGRRNGEISAFMDRVKAVPGLRIVLAGAGSSAFIGESMQRLLAAECGLRAQAVATTDIVADPDGTLADVPTLLVSYSRSGSSPESLGALEYAKGRVSQLYNLILVCKADSALADYTREMDNTLVLSMPPASCDLAFAMTSSVSCMALATWCLFNTLSLTESLNTLGQLADHVETDMPGMAEYAHRAAGWQFDRAVFLGSSHLCSLAREGAIKMLELSSGQVSAGWDTPTGFRHGPKSVINSQTLTVHLMSPERLTRKYDLDLLHEVLRQRSGNRVIQVDGMESGGSDADLTVPYTLDTGVSSRLCAYINGLVFVQLLALEKSLALGIATDTPQVGDVVNRVVQGVTIYPLD